MMSLPLLIGMKLMGWAPEIIVDTAVCSCSTAFTTYSYFCPLTWHILFPWATALW